MCAVSCWIAVRIAVRRENVGVYRVPKSVPKWCVYVLETTSPFEVSRAAPESARVRRAWVEPEAHGYINVKACPINPVLAGVENRERRKHKTDI